MRSAGTLAFPERSIQSQINTAAAGQACLKRMRSAGTLVFWMSLPSGPNFQYCVCTQCILTCWGASRTGAAGSVDEEHKCTGG